MNFLLAIWTALVRLTPRLNAIEAQLVRLDGKLDAVLDILTITAAGFQFTVQVEDQKPIVGATMLTMTDSQRAQLSIRPVDKRGKPAPLDAAPTWAGSDDTVVTVVTGKLEPDGSISPDDTGLFAVAEGVAPGTARITVTGDAQIGDGTVAITGVLEVEIKAGQAVIVQIDAGSPVEIP